MIDIMMLAQFYFEKLTRIFNLITVKAGAVEMPFTSFLAGCLIFGISLHIINVWSGLFLSFINPGFHLLGDNAGSSYGRYKHKRDGV